MKSISDTIIHEATIYRKKYPFIRWGQAIYNKAEDLYPVEVRKLTATEYDCYYDDLNVRKFLLELEKRLQ